MAIKTTRLSLVGLSSSRRALAGTARKEERAGRRGAGQVGTGEGWATSRTGR